MLAKLGYTTLGVVTLLRRSQAQAGWKGRALAVALALYLAMWLGLQIDYRLGLRWDRHELRLGIPEAAPPRPGGQIRRTLSGDFLWESFGPSP